MNKLQPSEEHPLDLWIYWVTSSLLPALHTTEPGHIRDDNRYALIRAHTQYDHHLFLFERTVVGVLPVASSNSGLRLPLHAQLHVRLHGRAICAALQHDVALR